MSGKVADLTEAEFEEKVLQSKIPVVVLFWAPWCGPCRYVHPIMEELSQKIPQESISFFRVNTDNNQALAMDHEVRSIPDVFFFNGGELVAREVGAKPLDVMSEIINRLLAEVSSEER